MADIILETIRAAVIGLLLYSIWQIGKKRGLNHQEGWGFVIGGWTLVFLGSLVDLTDNFQELNRFVLIGNTVPQAFLEKFVGFLVGYVLLFVGFRFWLPAGARKIDSMKDDFVSTVSHELRTPLTSILGSLKLVSSGQLGSLPQRAREPIGIALRNSERLSLLVNDILDIERLESGKVRLALTLRELSELVRESVEAARPLGEKYDVVFSMRGDVATGKVRVDPERLTQVMNNLLSNAAKFSPSNSTVEIGIQRSGDFLRVSVSDRGPGIPKEFRTGVFQKFAQGGAALGRKERGTGLGLAISKELIERMGGKIAFTTTMNQGTTFHFDLPRIPA